MSRWCQILFVFVFALGLSVRALAAIPASGAGEPSMEMHAAMAPMAATDAMHADRPDACPQHAMQGEPRVAALAPHAAIAAQHDSHTGHVGHTGTATSHHSCSPVCGACCIGAALPSSVAVIDTAEQVRIAKLRPQSALPPSFLTGGIERPPRFVLL